MKVMKCGCELQKVSKNVSFMLIHVNWCDSKFSSGRFLFQHAHHPTHQQLHDHYLNMLRCRDINMEKAEYIHEAELIRK